MSRIQDEFFEPRVADWLDHDPNHAPEDVLRTVLAAFPSIPQRRGPVIWRMPLGSTTRLGYVVAVVLIVATAILGLVAAGGFHPGVPSAPVTPSPRASATEGPSVSATARPEVSLSQFTSPRFGYSIDYPTGWAISAATQPLAPDVPPYADGSTVDTFTAPVTGPIPNGKLIGASTRLRARRSLDEWTSTVVLGWCGTPTTQEAVTIAGEPGLVTTFANCNGYLHLWATTIHQGAGFHLVWLNFSGAEQEDRALFEQILRSFEFPAPTRSP